MGSLVQTALDQVGVVRTVVEREARAQRTRYDAARMDRRRRDALAALGALIVERDREGTLGDLADDRALRAQLARIEDLERPRDHRGEDTQRGGAARWRRPEPSAPSSRSDGERVWRPRREPPRPARRDEPRAASAEPAHHGDPRGDAAPAPPGGAIQFGGAWDDHESDRDLEQYMCDDDVPTADEP